MRGRNLFCIVLFLIAPSVLPAQDGVFNNWFAQVDKTKEEQPHWITPVATTTPRLEEEFRYDQLWKNNNQGVTTNNYDGGKGLEAIPFERLEIIFNLPPYLAHNDPLIHDGFGDTAFLVKYRLLSANEKHGGYILTAFLGWTVPTGDYTNGAQRATITSTIAYGKGFRDFDVQGTFGVTFPTADAGPLGRTYNWNNAFQYRLFRKLWPEVEMNSTFFQGGKNAGQRQNFTTPGIVLGRFPLWGRIGFALGAGYEIATTRFHTINHNAILSVRFPF